MQMVRFVGIDPSSKTGLVALDESGNVDRAKELTGVGSHDPKRMVTLIDEIIAHIRPDDVIAIESPAVHAKGQGVGFMWGIAYGLRMALYRRRIPYIDVTPAQVKKFATGRGNAKKDEMVLPIFKRWGFEHSSDNVRDAYVLSQIAMATQIVVNMTKEQAEILDSILNRTTQRKKVKA